jgi:PAS domain S-box-containing protein
MFISSLKSVFSGAIQRTSLRTFMTVPFILLIAAAVGLTECLSLLSGTKAIVLCLVVLGVATIAGFLVLGRIANPILRLNAAAKSFAGGELTSTIAVEGPRELCELANSFNTMAARLREHIDNLEQKVAERTARIATVNQALARSEKEHRELFEHLRDAFVSTTMDGKFSKCNAAFEQMVGYSLEELRSMTQEDITPRKWHDFESGVILEEILDHGYSKIYEKEIIRNGGAVIPVELHNHLLRDDHDKPIGMWALVRDISDRKLAEEALRESERFYMGIIEFLPDATFVIDLGGKVIAWNRAIEDMTGVLKKDMVGKGEFAYAVPFYGKSRPILIDLVFHTDKEASQSYDLFEKKGDTLYAEAHVPMTCQRKGACLWAKASPLFDANGKLIGAIQSIRDITDYRLAEENLKQTRDYLENVLENSPDAVGIVNEHGRFLKWNRVATEIFGYTFEEIQGKLSFDLYTDQVELREMLTELRSKGFVKNREMQLKRRDGGIVPVELSLSLLKADGGSSAGSVCVARDLSDQKKLLNALRTTNEQLVQEIAERKKAEEALGESENTYRAIFENTGTATVILEEDTTISLANAQYEKLSGYSIEEIEGNMSWTEFVADGDMKRMREFHAQRRLDPESAPAQYEFNFVDRQGDVRNVLLTVGMIPGTNRSVASLLDITELRKMEEELVRAQKLESVGILAGGLAHDFNNLLGIILGNISLAQMDMSPATQIFKALKAAEKAVCDSRALTQQLITFSLGGAPVRRIESIQEILEGAVNLALAGSNLRCEFRSNEDLWRINCDSEQIRQVLMSLLMNAREAMPEGGIIEVAATNLQLPEGEILSLKGGKYVRISLTDHGTGIPEAHLGRIFDPYFSTKERGTQKGMGLGLTIAYSIVKRHEGHISVISQEGTGTTFHIYLPAFESSLAKKVDWEERPELGKGRVLFMDDEDMFRELATRMLSFIGYEVELAKDGAEAIRLFQSGRGSGKPFDVVILDLTVPGGMGGKEAIRELVRIDPSVKAIVSSGHAEDPVISNFEAFGFVAVLRKPYHLRDLRELLKDVMARIN